MAVGDLVEKPPTTKLELRTAYGPVYREVLLTPPREARSDEVPIIDIGTIYGGLHERQKLAAVIREAAENTGFFYIKNHGISQRSINGALSAAKQFFSQSDDVKLLVSKDKGRFFNGYSAKQTGSASRTEGLDYREAFMWHYEPQLDPDPKDPAAVPVEVQKWLRGEQYIWDGTEHLSGFKDGCITYWQDCLKLARHLVKIFALALDLPEDYFDALTTYPGSDGVLNYYPAMTAAQAATSQDIGIGSHTDLQCFTLLWQDEIGGLQVLAKDGQWLKVSPIPDTLIVNIGDYLMRLTNDRFKSTVHRVYNRSTIDRYSMPFFFGFNFNEKCGVLPNCTDADNPPKYEPVSCGDWCQLRFQQNDIAAKALSQQQPQTPVG